MARKENDAYYTPLDLASSLVGFLERDGLLPPGDIECLEPSVGEGAFLDATLERRPSGCFMAVDIEPGNLCATVHRDFLDLRTVMRFDFIVGNPPYAKPHPDGRVSPKTGKPIMVPTAEEHVRKALSLLAPGGRLAFLLRLAFLESQDRMPFWAEFPAEKVYVLSERPTFTGGGTDNSAYGFFVWRNGQRKPTELEVVSWK